MLTTAAEEAMDGGLGVAMRGGASGGSAGTPTAAAAPAADAPPAAAAAGVTSPAAAAAAAAPGGGGGAGGAAGAHAYFVRTPNGRLQVGEGRDLVVPNPVLMQWLQAAAPRTRTQGAAAVRALHAYAFLGRLAGVAARQRMPIALPLRLPTLWWKLVQGDAAGVTVADITEVDRTLGSLLARLASGDAGALASVPSWTIPSLSPEGEDIQLLGGFGGRPAVVTAATAPAFVRLAIAARVSEVLPAAAAFAQGLGSIIPLSAVRLLTPAELERRLCGSPGIDVPMLQRHTRLEGFAATSPVVARFWRVLAAMTAEEQSSVLKFVYARARLPASDAAFNAQFTLYRLPRSAPDATLPQAHSCTFQLDLPEYSSDAVMRRQLLAAASMSALYDLDGGATGAGS
jgi:hypothetical protein